jgi:hypothetical protein
VFSNQINSHFSFSPAGTYNCLIALDFPGKLSDLGTAITAFVLRLLRPSQRAALQPERDIRSLTGQQLGLNGVALTNYEAWRARVSAPNSEEDYVVVPGYQPPALFEMLSFAR